MHRIDDDTAQADANGPGRPGFTGGDPDLAIAPTIVTPAWLNAIQEEIARAVELDGPLNPASNEQLRTLLGKMGDARYLLPGTELRYANASRVAERRARHTYLPLSEFARNAYSVMGDGQIGVSCAPGADAPVVDTVCHLRLPTGARLTNVSCAVYGVLDTTWRLTTRRVTFNPFAAPTLSGEVTEAVTMGVAGSTPLSNPVSFEVDNNLSRIEIVIRATRSAAPPFNLMGMIHCVHIGWDDPGPLNDD